MSMPGMMDTVLNVGLTVRGAELLAERTGDPRFAWTSLERLLDGFARTVRGVGAGELAQRHPPGVTRSRQPGDPA